MTATIVRPNLGETSPVRGGHFVPQDALRLTWRVSQGLVGVQLLGMLIFTTVQYGRFNLTTDFAAYSQAWAAIAHGHFDPYSSVFGLFFWRNDFELLMWPLALCYWIYPHAVTLLWLQALAVCAGELVVLQWAREVLASARGGHRNAPRFLALVALLLVVTPWSWFTIGFDFHLVPFVALFALLGGRDLWSGRSRRLWLWALLTLSCAAASGALCVMALGVASLLSQRTSRRAALALVVTGGAWLALASGIGAMSFRGLTLGPMYGYLVGNPAGSVGMVQVAEGLLRHPLRAFQMLRSHAGYLAGYVASGGAIGLRSWWGVAPAAIVLLPSALNANPDFIHFAQAFQSWPAVLFLTIGTAFALRGLAGNAPKPGAAYLLGGCTLALAAGVMVVNLSQIPTYLHRVTPQAVQKLAQIGKRIPQGAEVVVSQGVIGRFGVGRAAYPYWADGAPERYPVDGSGIAVVFVLTPSQGTAEGLVTETHHAIAYVEGRLHARPMREGAGVWSFIWHPAAGTKTVVLP